MEEYARARWSASVRGYGGNCLLTDNSQVDEFWVQRSPTEATEVDVAIVHLARSLVEDPAKDEEEQQRCDV